MSDLPTSALLPAVPPPSLSREQHMQLQIVEKAQVSRVVNILRSNNNINTSLNLIAKEFECDEASALLRMSDPDVQAMLNAEIRTLRLMRGRSVEQVSAERAGDTVQRLFDALQDALGSEPSAETNERIKYCTAALQAMGYTPDVALQEQPVQSAQQQQINIQVNSTQNTIANQPWKERSIQARKGHAQMTPDGVIIEGKSESNK